jgi:hypothetical protein
MNRSSRNEYAVAWLRDDVHEVVHDCPVSQRMAQIVGRCAWFQTRIDAASFFSLDYNPCFGLCRIARWNQLRMRIAGMYLHGKQFVCIKKLEE